MPSLKELIEQRLKEQEEKEKLLEEKKEKTTIKTKTTIKQPPKEPSIAEIPEGAINITSDAIRTASYLIEGHSTRGNIVGIFNDLEVFLSRHKIIEPKRNEFYIIKK